MNWYLEVLRKYAVFSGRARRKEYWMFVLFNLIILIAIGLVETLLAIRPEQGTGILSTIYGLAVLIPSLAVGARRLHDTGRTAWWLLLLLIPVIGHIILIFLFVLDSDPGDNKYGRNPKTLPEPGMRSARTPQPTT